MDTVLFLISKGCNSNRPSSDGWTALQIAIKHECKDSFMGLLVDPLLNLNENTTKETALHVAARLGRV
jgi:ankyrin repeat protein